MKPWWQSGRRKVGGSTGERRRGFKRGTAGVADIMGAATAVPYWAAR